MWICCEIGDDNCVVLSYFHDVGGNKAFAHGCASGLINVKKFLKLIGAVRMIWLVQCPVGKFY